MSMGRSGRLVGRERELAAFREWLARAGGGSGGVYVIAGEPGVGKSRLAGEVLAALPAAWLVARGRATDRERPAPFRAVAEALLAASRDHLLPDDPDVRAFAAVLGHLVPAWRWGGGTDEPVVVVAEAVLRVLRAMAVPFPAVMLIEDVQWADPETLAVLEYLADNVAGQRTAIVVTVRSDTPSPGLSVVHDLAARRVAVLVELARLCSDDVTAMACECLGAVSVDAGIHAFLDRAGGLPFLVEELLATAARDGILVEREARWVLAGASAGVVPDSYLDSVSRRLGVLSADAALVTRVAAVAGLATDMRLLGLSAGLSPAEAGAAAQAASDAGLVVLGQDGQRVGFRHALVREAVLADLRPGERALLASRSLDALAGKGPGVLGAGLAGAGPELSDDALELVVDLAEQAGELARSARLLLALAGRAMAAGGLATAEACLRRARRRTAGDLALTAGVDEALLELLARKGDLPELEEAAAVAHASLGRLGAGPARAANVHLNVARAAAAAGNSAWAAEEAGRAQALAVDAGDVPLRLSADVAAAEALLSAGDTCQAAKLARQVISSSQAPIATLLQARMVVGRAERVHDLEAAAAAFDAAHSLAFRSGSPLAELDALHELATVAMLSQGDDGLLLTARARAEQLGAVGLVAQLNLQLAGTYALTGRAAEALTAAERARDLAHRLGQVTVEAMALVQAATGHAVREAGRDMRAAAGAALTLAGDDPSVIAGVWGHAYAIYALLREDRATARDVLNRAIVVASRATGIHGLFWAPWALVSLLGSPDQPADAILDQLNAAAATALPVNRGLASYAHAVAAGLGGDSERACLLMTEADRVLAARPAFGLWRQLCRRLAAEAALACGWGDPVSWLRECLAAFDASGHRHTATACRVLLHRAGATVPRRSGEAGAPPDLAALGVTAREADVLRLVADGLTNREIGERLFLSPRTVEKHVERLLAKTGVHNRSQLVARAARRDTTLRTYRPRRSRGIFPIPVATADGSLVVMTHTTVTPVPVSFDDAGHGEPALVYLTGWCSTRTSYTATMEHTARYHRSIAIDWRGHGTSPAAEGDFGWSQMADDVLAVLDGCGVDRFVPVANAHAGWVGRDLAERVPDRVAGVVLINWLVLGAPPPFTAGLDALADPATTRAAAESLTASWLDGHEDVPGLAEQITAMRQHSDEMWACAGREIAAAYTARTSPLQAFAALPVPPPARHLYAEPKDPAFLAAQQDFARIHPWFTVRRLDTAHTHFPMLEQPADLAGDVTRFVGSLSRTPRQPT